MTSDAPKLILKYASPSKPWWVWTLVILYGLGMLTLLCLPLYAASPSGGADRDERIAITITVTLLTLAWFSLLRIPVHMRQRRPITRRGLWLPIFGSAILFAALVVGASLAAGEVYDEKLTALEGWVPVWIAIAGWIAWSIVFWLISRSRDPEQFGSKLHRYILAGSVLELLIAVPAHIIVRRRTECCAGIATGIGICFGVAVMLVAFGPSVFFLYYRRFKQIRN